MSKKKELSKELKRDWAIFKGLMVVSAIVITLGIVQTISNMFGACDECGKEARLHKYTNKFDTYMYCESCYDLNHFLDN
jgi:hypothetical protein